MPGGSSDGIVHVGGVLLSMMVAQQVADAIPDHLKIEGSSNLRGSMDHVKESNAKETAQTIPNPVSAETLMQQELPGIVQSTLTEFMKSGFSKTLASAMMIQLSMTAATLLGQQLAHAMCAKRAAPNAKEKNHQPHHKKILTPLALGFSTTKHSNSQKMCPRSHT